MINNARMWSSLYLLKGDKSPKGKTHNAVYVEHLESVYGPNHDTFSFISHPTESSQIQAESQLI